MVFCLFVCLTTIFKSSFGDMVTLHVPCQSPPNIPAFVFYSFSPFLLAWLCFLFDLTTGFISEECFQLASFHCPPCAPPALSSHTVDFPHSLLSKILKFLSL